MGAVVSPDGRYVYYAQRTGTFTYNARFPLWQVYRHDRETGDVMQVTNAPGSAMRPALSPDGRWLVYGTRHKTETGLRVRNLETGAERWLAYPVTHDDQESRATRDTLPRYAFMPDGKSLLVPIGGKLQRIDFETGAATPVPFTAKVQAEIAPRAYTPVRVDDGASVRARLIRWPSVSPDGRHLVFSAMNRLYVMDLPGGTPRLLRGRHRDHREASAPPQRVKHIRIGTAEGKAHDRDGNLEKEGQLRLPLIVIPNRLSQGYSQALRLRGEAFAVSPQRLVVNGTGLRDEEVDAERGRGQGPGLGDLRPQRVRRLVTGGEKGESSRLTHGRGQRRRPRAAGHGRLDDRMAKQVAQCRGHVLSILTLTAQGTHGI